MFAFGDAQSQEEEGFVVFISFSLGGSGGHSEGSADAQCHGPLNMCTTRTHHKNRFESYVHNSRGFLSCSVHESTGRVHQSQLYWIYLQCDDIVYFLRTSTHWILLSSLVKTRPSSHRLCVLVHRSFPKTTITEDNTVKGTKQPHFSWSNLCYLKERKTES